MHTPYEHRGIPLLYVKASGESERCRIARRKTQFNQAHILAGLRYGVCKVKFVKIGCNLRQRTHEPVLKDIDVIIVEVYFAERILEQGLHTLEVCNLVDTVLTDCAYQLLLVTRIAAVDNLRNLLLDRERKYLAA